MRSIRHAQKMHDPRTGIPLVPLGRRKDGRLIWPIMGGSGEGEGEGGEGGDEAAQAAAQAAADAATKATADAAAAAAAANETPWADPEKAKAEIERLRKENGSARTGAKAKAAEEAKAEMLESIQKALGLKSDQAPTVEDLTKQLTEKDTAAQSAAKVARDAQVQLAVFQKAATHQGDPTALLDSNSFLAKLSDLDPSADDFAAKVDEAIKTAVDANPKLKTGQVSGSSSADHSGGAGGGAPRKPMSLDQAVSGHYGT